MSEPDVPQYGPNQAAVLALVPHAAQVNEDFITAVAARTPGDDPWVEALTAQVCELTRQNLALAYQAMNKWDDVTPIVGGGSG